MIDDGSHIKAHQVTTFYTLFEHRRDGGTYVIEDIQTSFRQDRSAVRTSSAPPSLRRAPGRCGSWRKYLNHAEIPEP
jgi:hypothetical protein